MVLPLGNPRRGDGPPERRSPAPAVARAPRPGSRSSRREPLAPRRAGTAAVVGSVTRHSGPDRATVRIPLSQRVPFRVEETDRSLVVTLYGASGDVDWMRYGATDSLVRRMSWRQDAADEVSLTFELSRPVWGYRTRWDRSDLVARHPSTPGHRRRATRSAAGSSRWTPATRRAAPWVPPGFARRRPTWAWRSSCGACWRRQARRVLMTRTTDSVVDLWPRVQLGGAGRRRRARLDPQQRACRTASIRSSTTAPASTTTSRGAFRWRAPIQAALAPPPRPPRPRHRPRRPRPRARDLDALGPHGRALHDDARPGGGAALGRGAATATRRRFSTGCASILRTYAAQSP